MNTYDEIRTKVEPKSIKRRILAGKVKRAPG